jgi:hypothetical protein
MLLKLRCLLSEDAVVYARVLNVWLMSPSGEVNTRTTGTRIELVPISREFRWAAQPRSKLEGVRRQEGATLVRVGWQGRYSTLPGSWILWVRLPSTAEREWWCSVISDCYLYRARVIETRTSFGDLMTALSTRWSWKGETWRVVDLEILI